MEPFLKAVKEGEPDLLPLAGALSVDRRERRFRPDRNQGVPVAIRYDDKARKVFNTALTPEFKASVELADKWMQAGYAPTEAPPDPQEARNAGK